MLTRRTRQVLLTFTAILMASILALFVANPGLARDPKRPAGAQELAEWITRHPADWQAAAALADVALDSSLPNRVALWRAAYETSRRLAPRRPNGAAAFVRSGFFHWSELGGADRKAVLEAAEPLLQNDAALFQQLQRPLYQLTRDFDYLRRVAPRDPAAIAGLRNLAAMYGHFDEYRALRDEVRRLRVETFRKQRSTAPVAELLALVPSPITAADAPLVRELLEELDQRPFDAAQFHRGADELATFALDHDLGPLSALTPLIESGGPVLRPVTRARLARATGDRAAASRVELSAPAGPSAPPRPGAWSGLCGSDEICNTAEGLHRLPLTLTLEVTQSDGTPPYVEIYVADTLVAEGEVRDQRSFTVGTGNAEDRVELRVVNPVTPGGIQRRLKLRSGA